MKLDKLDKEIMEVIEKDARQANSVLDLFSISGIANELGEPPTTVRDHIEKLEENGLIEDKTEGKEKFNGRRFTPQGFEIGNDTIQENKQKIRETRNKLRRRILREPTKKEVAEELGEPFDKSFKAEFSAAVDNYDEPSEEQIEYAKKELEGRLRRSLILYHGARSENLKPENMDTRPVGKEYLEKNRDIFEDFTLTGIGHNEYGQARIRVEPPNYIAKFLEKPKFILNTTSPEEFNLDYGEDTIGKVEPRNNIQIRKIERKQEEK